MSDYNGWTNYETWNLKLWLDNDEGTYHYWQEAAREAMRTGYKGESLDILSDQLENQTREEAPQLTGFYSDIQTASLEAVDYYEIAKAMLADLDEEEDN